MFRDIVSTLSGWLGVFCVGVVFAGGVELEVAEWSSVGGDDVDVLVVDVDEDGCAGVAAAEADVVEPAVVAEGEFSVAVGLLSILSWRTR